MESSREDDVFEQQVLMQSVQQDPTGMAPGGLWVRVMKLEGVLACCCLKTSLGNKMRDLHPEGQPASGRCRDTAARHRPTPPTGRDSVAAAPSTSAGCALSS
jgi:hypothetical protein